MIKCYACGARFEEDEARDRLELVSEFWGAPAYATIKTCPSCGSDDIQETQEDEEEDEAKEE